MKQKGETAAAISGASMRFEAASRETSGAENFKKRKENNFKGEFASTATGIARNTLHYVRLIFACEQDDF